MIANILYPPRQPQQLHLNRSWSWNLLEVTTMTITRVLQATVSETCVMMCHYQSQAEWRRGRFTIFDCPTQNYKALEPIYW